MSRLLRLFALLLLAGLLLPAATALPATPVPANRHATGMPPQPDLEDRIRRGEVTAPQFLVSAASTELVQAQEAGSTAKLTGQIRSLAVLVDFSDKVHSVQASFFDSLIFAAPVPGRGSVRDYFDEVSYGQVDLVTLNLPSSLGWQRAPQSYSYYVNGQHCTDGAYPHNCQKLAEDVVDAIQGVVNFADYDNNHDGVMEPIMLIHAGPGAEQTGSASDVWSHAASMRSPRRYDGVTIGDYVIMPEYFLSGGRRYDMTIGVFAHEMVHGLWGLPDLYDRDYSSNGIGSWSLMAAGSWNGPNVGFGASGSSPAWPDAWSRIQMGLVRPTSISTNLAGQQVLQVAGGSPASTVFRLGNGKLGSREYFLVENRQRTAGTYDEYLPGSGLLIWHVDEAKANSSEQNDHECRTEPDSSCPTTHYLVALEQADGQHHLENKTNRGDAGDAFSSSANNRSWTYGTNPGSSSWYSTGPTDIAVTNIGPSAASMAVGLRVAALNLPRKLYLPMLRQ